MVSVLFNNSHYEFDARSIFKNVLGRWQEENTRSYAGIVSSISKVRLHVLVQPFFPQTFPPNILLLP